MMLKSKSIPAIVIAIGLLVASVPGVGAQSEAESEPSPSPADGSAAPAVESEGLQPPAAVEGFAWADVSELVGAEIEATATERSLGEWATLLEGTGATFDQASQLNARAVDAETEETIGVYSAIRITGADEAQLREAMLDTLRGGPDPEAFTFEDAQISGKDVTIITLETDERAIVYVEGDTAHLLDLPDEFLSAIVESLP